MKKLLGILIVVLTMSFSSLNANEIKTEDTFYSACHDVVDYIMIAAIEAGDYDGNNAGALEDWNTLYDVCDIIDSL